MNLSPFSKVNPCGLQGMKMTQLAHLVSTKNCPTTDQAGLAIAHILSQSITAAAQ